MVSDNEGRDGSPAVDDPPQAVTAVTKKLGRPPKLALDERTLGRIEGLASTGCTVEEIASALNVDKKTFLKFRSDHPEVGQAYEQGWALGRVSLRRQQFRLAKTNARMAIHLGVNYLDQHRGNRSSKKPPTPGKPRRGL
jgi:hypothetical protein